MIGILGLILATVCFVTLSYRGWNIVISSIISGAIAVLLTGGDLCTGFFVDYSKGLAGFAGEWWALFILGAVFGNCMKESGLAVSIASTLYLKLGSRNVILIVLIISLLLSYGGIGTFIIAFTLYPIVNNLFMRAGICRSLLPAALLFCPTTIAMTMLSGTPSIQNILPTRYLNTTIYAAPFTSLICSVVAFSLGYLYLSRQANRKKNSSSVSVKEEREPICKNKKTAFLPCILLWTITFLLNLLKFDSTISVTIAMLVSIVCCFFIGEKSINIKSVLDSGIKNGLQSLMITSCIMGYGTLIKSTSGFALCSDLLFNIKMPSIITAVVSINAIAAITGSSIGSLQIFFDCFSHQLMQSGLQPQALHRVLAIASSGMDSMPYATGIVVTNELAKTTLKDTYVHIFITCAIVPLISMVFAILMNYHFQ